jgi:hypothetical protein
MNPKPELTTLEAIQQRSGYQSFQPVTRPEYWGVDRDPSRRPGVPMMRPPQPWPNTRFPPERQPGEPAAPMHGRPNKPMPAVFGTAVPLRGLSGVVRKFAYTYADHYPSHWLLMMLGDRVDSWSTHSRRILRVALPLVALGLVGHLVRR